jgi:hypothetical protein
MRLSEKWRLVPVTGKPHDKSGVDIRDVPARWGAEANEENYAGIDTYIWKFASSVWLTPLLRVL